MEEESGTVYVPYTEEVNASVWCVDTALQMFTNLSEESAVLLAELYPAHNYFFAEFAVQTDVEWLEKQLNDGSGI